MTTAPRSPAPIPRSAPGSGRSAGRCRRVELEIRDPLGRGRSPPASPARSTCAASRSSGEYQGRSALDSDGWFPTNDGGYLDAEGYLFVEGRLDDVIVRGGENLSPGEIEDVLLAHPAVAEAAVVGVPDDEWGEVVAAAVVLEPAATVTAAELQVWVRDRLRSSRMPELVEFRQELPYNDTGKLLRRLLKADLEALAREGR